MKFNNLDINILYLVCKELVKRNQCGHVTPDVIYQTFPDIPDEQIDSTIRSLVGKGLLEENNDLSQLHITARGLSKIRSFAPSKQINACERSRNCGVY
jgi:hypothetical protein